MKLRGVILARIETELDGRLAHTYVLKEDFEKTGALPSDTEDVINIGAGDRRHAGGRDLRRAAERRLQDQLPQPLRTSIAASWPRSSAAAATRRRPARFCKARWPRCSRSSLTLFARRCDSVRFRPGNRAGPRGIASGLAA